MLSTPYKVSTITATGSVNALLDLGLFYEHLLLIKPEEETDGIIFVEFGMKKMDTISRGTQRRNRRQKKDARRFDNQVTVILKMLLQGSYVYVNVKVFKNGNIQMTGLKDINQGKIVVDHIIVQLKQIVDQYPHVATLAEGETIKNCDYKIRLINSDFKVNLEIKRDKLNKVMQNAYAIRSSFEPCIYPGVKIQFFWNDTKKRNDDGICECSCCDGKGTGSGEGNCKKITIAVFQSGCIIITGALTYEQIDDAYLFICDAIKTHRSEFEK